MCSFTPFTINTPLWNSKWKENTLQNTRPPKKMNIKVLQSDEIIFRLWSPLISEDRHENQKRTTDFKWSFLDLRECHCRLNATFKCCFCLWELFNRWFHPKSNNVYIFAQRNQYQATLTKITACHTRKNIESFLLLTANVMFTWIYLNSVSTYSFSVRFGFVFYSFFRLGIEFCVNMTSNDNLHARLKSVPSLLDWVDLILKSVYRILAVLILGFYLWEVLEMQLSL